MPRKPVPPPIDPAMPAPAMPAPATPTPTVDDPVPPRTAPPDQGPGTRTGPDPIRKKDFVALTVARAGVRKADARAVIDAALLVLAESLVPGQDLVLPPLGKIRVVREKSGGGNRQVMLRVTLADTGTDDTGSGRQTPPDPLAETGDRG